MSFEKFVNSMTSTAPADAFAALHNYVSYECNVGSPPINDKTTRFPVELWMSIANRMTFIKSSSYEVLFSIVFMLKQYKQL